MLRIFSYVCRLSVCLPWKMSIQVLCSFLTGLSGFFNSHVWMWELDHKEGWVTKKWCFKIVVLEKTLESPLDCKEIKPVNLKGNQPRIFIGRTDAEAETPVLWITVAESRLIGKDPDAGKNWRQQEKGTTEDEIVGCHHRLNGHGSEQTQENSGEQRSLACCSLAKSWTWLSDWTATTCFFEVELYEYFVYFLY